MNDLGVPAEQSIYTGTWINWSKGRALGSTLTLSSQNGGLLVAFLALFVSFAGTSFFRVTCFVIHQRGSTNSPRDALYHQTQAILRNSASGTSAFVDLSTLAWAWRTKKMNAPTRILPLALYSCIVLAAFGIAGVFSSRIASLTGDEVLIQSPNMEIKIGDIMGNSSSNTTSTLIFPFLSKRLNVFKTHAQNCYTDAPRVADCSTFVKQNLSLSVERNATCPFAETMCKSKNGNIKIDTGLIDTQDALGVNTPPNDRVFFRNSLHCAPLITDGYAENLNYTTDGISMPYRTYHYGGPGYGQHPQTNYTYIHADYTIPQIHFENFQSELPRYGLGTSTAYVANGSWIPGTAGIKMIDDLFRKDSDVFLVFLSAKDILYPDIVEDPWYSAHLLAGEASEGLDSNVTGRQKFYRADEAGSPLGCAIQYQMCVDAKTNCSPLGGLNDLDLFASALDDNQYNKTRWFRQRLAFMTLPEMIIPILGGEVLDATNRLSGWFGGQLPVDQWQADVFRWSTILLATLQSSAVDAATGPSDSRLLWWFGGPRNRQEETYMHNQKIRSTAFVNFSILGLTLTVVLGGVFIAAEYLMEAVTKRWLYKHYRSQEYAYAEWSANGTLQLQRLAHEELGYGSWEKCDGPAPITTSKTNLGVLDIGDVAHPRLRSHEATTATDQEKPELISTIDSVEEAQHKTPLVTSHTAESPIHAREDDSTQILAGSSPAGGPMYYQRESLEVTGDNNLSVGQSSHR